MPEFTIQYFKITLKGAKIYKKRSFFANLPIELKPSLAPLEPRCLSFCDPDRHEKGLVCFNTPTN